MRRGGVEGGGWGGRLWYDAKEFDINPIIVILISWFLFSSNLGLVKMCRISGYLQGVWRVSGRRLELSN